MKTYYIFIYAPRDYQIHSISVDVLDLGKNIELHDIFDNHNLQTSKNFLDGKLATTLSKGIWTRIESKSKIIGALFT